MKIGFPFKVLLCLILILIFAPSAKPQTPEPVSEIFCTPVTLVQCYEQAKIFYHDKNFETAKGLFEKIIAVDVGYKHAARYLKKCHHYIAEAAIAAQSKAQRKKQKGAELKKPETEKSKEAEKEAQDPGEETAYEKIEDYPSAAETLEGPQAEAFQKVASYRIGGGDILEITVWRNEDLDKSVIVGPDGRISYPLIGTVPAVGLTIEELDQILTKELKRFIRSPEVSVAIQKFGGMKVILLGEVKGPGIYTPSGGATIIDVIASAGGFSDNAVKHGTFVIRGTGPGQTQIYRLNLARIFKGDLSQNITLASNDIIYVPKRFIARLNFAISQITPLLSNTLLGTTTYRDIKDLVGSGSTKSK